MSNDRRITPWMPRLDHMRALLRAAKLNLGKLSPTLRHEVVLLLGRRSLEGDLRRFGTVPVASPASGH